MPLPNHLFRIVPNDDLVLNLRRKQSFGNPGSIGGPRVPKKPNNLRARSMVELDRAGMDIREISLEQEQEQKKLSQGE